MNMSGTISHVEKKFSFRAGHVIWRPIYFMFSLAALSQTVTNNSQAARHSHAL